jgi:hypothetical protein
MPLSKQINVHRLVPNKKYVIEIQWNITNDIRMQSATILTGTFIDAKFQRGRSMSFDTGLEILVSKPRIESRFMINETIHTISSVNKFYEILHPNPVEIANVYAIFHLPIPNDLKKIVNYYIGNRKKLYYRKKRVKSRDKIKPQDNLPVATSHTVPVPY